jgi:RecA-family ATPase
MKGVADEFKPDLIVIDTTTAACQLKDENDNAEATEAIQKLRGVQRLNGSCMLLLKHAKVDIENGTQTVRGAKAWVGATDATLIHMVASGKPRTDGLRDSQVVPEKIRAFGLQGTLKIKPSWVDINGEKGLSLASV